MKCQPCDREFGSMDALEMHNRAKHGLKVSSEDKDKHHKKRQMAKKYKKRLKYIILILAVGLLLFWFINTARNYETPFTEGQIHWHANIQLSACGKNVPLPRPVSGTSVHGSSFIGTPLMHLHDGPTIHVEGLIRKEEEIFLGNFMKVINLNFNNDQFLEYKNGDLCPNGEPGKVKLLVNGVESSKLADKTIRDKERYQIVFE